MKTKSKLSAYIPTLTKEMTSIASRTYFFCLMCVMLFAWACVAPVRGEVISVSFGGAGGRARRLSGQWTSPAHWTPNWMPLLNSLRLHDPKKRRITKRGAGG